jgi:hypothetical protein
MMRTPRARRRQAGVLLLTVALLLATMAALAFSLNRAAGMDVQSVAGDYDRRNAGYLTEAAVAAAKWKNELTACDAKLVPLPGFPLAGATLSATVTKGAGKQINVVATATVGATGASDTLTRSNISIVDLTTKQQKDLGGGTRDTYVTSTSSAPQGGAKSLVLTSGSSNGLLFWPMNDIPGNSEVLSAQLTMTQPSGSTVARTVNLHQITTQWDLSATWTQARPLVGWASPGGDYAPAAIASADVTGAGAYTWDVSNVVDDWVNGRQTNNGFLLRLLNASQTVTFNSLEAASQKPVLHVMFVKQC